MKNKDSGNVESKWTSDFAQIMESESLISQCDNRRRLEIDPDNVKNGLAQLVLTLVRLLHELLERQTIRRIEGGTLSDEEIERVGVALMRQAEEIERLREAFNLEPEDLNLDLGPLGKLI